MKRIFRVIYWPLVAYLGWIITITPVLYFGQAEGQNLSLWDAFLINSIVYGVLLAVTLAVTGLLYVAHKLYEWCFDV